MKTKTKGVSVREIGLQLQIAANTVSKYLRMAGAPKRRPGGGYDLEEVTRFIQSRTTNSTTAVRVDATIRALKERELRLKCERLEWRLQLEKGDYVHRSIIQRDMDTVTMMQQGFLRSRLENELPHHLVGADFHTIQQHMKAAVSEFIGFMRSNLYCKDPDGIFRNAEGRQASPEAAAAALREQQKEYDQHIKTNENTNENQTK